ncbi:MAG TPA: C1 family peptidase, partial [Fimbriimonadaceae bacterium]|nr:C1 family peptidase [Fimbriimonadaceae bacterium]
ERFQKEFEKEPRNRQAMNAVCTTGLNKVALNRRRVNELDRTFSVHLPENSVTAQKASGRCWLFAALNTFRNYAIKSMNLDEKFELSQNYALFWDKLEKANYFLDNVLVTLDEPVGSRLLSWLLQSPVQDGGQWDMFANLIRKYGVVPKSAMPETDSSSATGMMSGQITGKLREYACRLRAAHEKGVPMERLVEMKKEYVGEVYRMLTIHLGEPPKSFDWQWRDKDKGFHRAGRLTPQEFYDKYVGVNLDDLVCLIHDPRPGHGFNQAYTVKFLGNVSGGRPVEYLNVDLGTIKHAAIKQLEEGASVWFGCDVGPYLDRDLGTMDIRQFDYDLVYGTKLGLTKAERLMYGHSAMSHAMVFTGVDLDDQGKPKKWRVENSWGEDPGFKGWFQMTDEWFDEYTFEVLVEKRFVPAESLAALKKAPIELDPWDPMGSLA